MVTAAIFVILIDGEFNAMMQFGFAASEMDLNSDRLGLTFSKIAYTAGILQKKIRGPE